MKTQSSLEVPKQVRSASFDEIQLEAKRNQQQAAEDKGCGPGEGAGGFLKVPQFVNQRSKSFDSGGSEDSAMYLEVPRRFQRRRSSSDKMPAICFHCSCVEEYWRLCPVAQAEEMALDHQHQTRSLSCSDTSCSDSDDEEEMNPKDESFDVNTPNSQCSIRVTLSPNSPSSPSLECPTGDEDVPGTPTSRRRSITSPKLARQEAVFVLEPGTNSLENISDVTSEGSDAVSGGSVGSGVGGDAEVIVNDIYLKVPDLKRDRAASVDSCFTKVSSNNKTEELDQVLSLQVPQVTLRSRSVDIVLPTDEQARYKALAMANTSPYGPTVKGYVLSCINTISMVLC
jgi:diacylglycerol kinase (ATP)